MTTTDLLRRKSISFAAICLYAVLACCFIHRVRACTSYTCGYSCCSGECVDTQNDVLNCLECGYSCRDQSSFGHDWLCCSGACFMQSVGMCGGCDVGCDTSQYNDCCDSTCANLNFDSLNCGECGNNCNAVSSRDTETVFGCCDGSCVDFTADEHCGACERNCVNEGRTCCGQQCVDFFSDAQNCGACGVPCAAGFSCCDGQCIDLRSDVEHCGVCQGSCAAGDTCCNGTCARLSSASEHCGACGLACAAGSTCCNGTCADLRSSSLNCGACGVACELCCGGVCVDRTSDNNHCGNCGSACLVNMGAQCCGGECAILASDVLHCGKCDRLCTSGESCSGGSCMFLQLPPLTPPVVSPQCIVDGDCTSVDRCHTSRCVNGTCLKSPLQCPLSDNPCVNVICDTTRGCLQEYDAKCSACFQIQDCAQCQQMPDCTFLVCPASVDLVDALIPPGAGVHLQQNVTFVNGTALVGIGSTRLNVSFSVNLSTTFEARLVCAPLVLYRDANTSALRELCPSALCTNISSGGASFPDGAIGGLVAGLSLLPLIALASLAALLALFFVRCRRRAPGTWIEPDELLADFAIDGLVNSPLYVDPHLIEDSKIFRVDLAEWD